MIRATKAITLEDKRNLLAVWKEMYKPEIVEELLRVAKDQAARHRIANWNLANFEGDRIAKSISSSSNNNVKQKRVKQNNTKYK